MNSKVGRSRNGMVVAAHPVAAEAGAEVLRRGGNAVEAAVATSLTLGVVEPFASGLGGGAYLMICPKGEGSKTEIIDGRGTASTLLGGERTYPFGITLPWMARFGVMTAAIPGLGRALALALKRHGGTVKLSRLCEPAIDAAQRGFKISKTFVRCQNSFEAVVRATPETARVFLNKGRLRKAGERLKQPDLARTLQRVARNGFEELYTGQTGRRIVREVNRSGPVWGPRDLARYEPKIRTPLRATVAGQEIATMPPPSRGGAGIVMALRELEKMRSLAPNSSELIVRMVNLFKKTFETLEPRIADPDFADVAMDELIPSAGTSHFVVADREGTLVSVSQTIGHFFGAGVVVDGVLLNDDVADCERGPGRPNSVQPGRRVVSNMAPTIVIRGGRPVMALGTPGTLRIFPAMTQVLANALLHGMSLEEAVGAARVHWEEGTVHLEGHVDTGVRAEVRKRIDGRVIERGPNDLYFGGVHALSVEADGTVVGVADPRRDGVAAGV